MIYIPGFAYLSFVLSDLSSSFLCIFLSLCLASAPMFSRCPSWSLDSCLVTLVSMLSLFPSQSCLSVTVASYPHYVVFLPSIIPRSLFLVYFLVCFSLGFLVSSFKIYFVFVVVISSNKAAACNQISRVWVVRLGPASCLPHSKHWQKVIVPSRVSPRERSGPHLQPLTSFSLGQNVLNMVIKVRHLGLIIRNDLRP